ncbi:MAG: HEAT repeat domain-containing protein [Myxococcales bacterium]|nr:HEAT repeat domain-containing protein [Myxococcales bacterium]
MLTDVARSLGATLVPGGVTGRPKVWRAEDGLSLTLGPVIDANGSRITSVFRLVVTSEQLPLDLEIEVANLSTALKRAIYGADIQLGVPAIDAALAIRTENELDAVARLHAPAREAALAATRIGAIFQGGEWRCDLTDIAPNAETIVARANLLWEAARTLAARGPIADRLLASVRSDPSPGYRRRSLELMVRHHLATAPQAIQIALEDPDVSVALRAAVHAGADGVAVLHRIVRQPGPEDVRVEALEHLSAAADSPDLRATLDALVNRSPRRLRCAALRLMVRIGYGPIARLSRLVGDGDAEVRAHAAGALRHAGPPPQPPLLTLLADKDEAVAAAAARSLGLIADADQVGTLLARAEGLFTSGDLKQAVRQAVATIQARYGGPEAAGRLALAERPPPDAGHLTLTDDGRLSRAEPLESE